MSQLFWGHLAVVISFTHDLPTLKQVKRLQERLKTGLLFGGVSEGG